MAVLNIQMNTPKGVTLNTKGVYCDDNITVTPKLQTAVVAPVSIEKTLTATEGYAGIGKIIVKPNGDSVVNYLVEIGTEDAMDFVLTNGSNGQMYKYIGPEGKYVPGTIYILEVK